MQTSCKEYMPHILNLWYILCLLELQRGLSDMLRWSMEHSTMDMDKLWGTVSKYVPNGSNTAVMDIIGFLCVSLCSSTVQLLDSLGSRHTCTCSEDVSISQHGNRAWGVYYWIPAMCCASFWATELNAKHIHTEMFPVYGGKVCCPQLGREILSKMFGSCLTRSPCWDCDRSNCATGERVDSSWQRDNDRQYSNCTGVYPWFSIQHSAWSFEVSESVHMAGAQRTEGSRKNKEPNGSVLATSLTVCRWRRWYV
jgi:hypothetical protein